MAKENKLYMEMWFFWVITLILFIFIIVSISLIYGSFTPDSNCESCEAIKSDLIECKESLFNIIDAYDGYNEALKDYCEIDYTNPLCDVLLPDN